jgi:hypothetical protein
MQVLSAAKMRYVGRYVSGQMVAKVLNAVVTVKKQCGEVNCV